MGTAKYIAAGLLAGLAAQPLAATSWLLSFSGRTSEPIQYYGYSCTDSSDCWTMGTLPDHPVTIGGRFFQDPLLPGESATFASLPFTADGFVSNPPFSWDPHSSLFSGTLHYDGHALWASDISFTYSTDSATGDRCTNGSGLVCHLIYGTIARASVQLVDAGDAAPPVPEPASWMTLILGLGFAAAAMRMGRRPRPVAA